MAPQLIAFFYNQTDFAHEQVDGEQILRISGHAHNQLSKRMGAVAVNMVTYNLQCPYHIFPLLIDVFMVYQKGAVDF